jgi:hypothetical protein
MKAPTTGEARPTTTAQTATAMVAEKTSHLRVSIRRGRYTEKV